MKKEDMTIVDLLLEAVGIVAGLVYFCLQIYFGVVNCSGGIRITMNILTLLLVYMGLTLLQFYPERVNGLSREECSGKVRKYTIHMVRDIKLVFILSLLFTSICDVIGNELDSAYSLFVSGLMIVLAIYFEVKIIRILRSGRKNGKD